MWLRYENKQVLFTKLRQTIVPLQCDSNGLKLQRQAYRGADKSLAQPTSRCILFDGENISFDILIYLLTAIGLSPGGSLMLVLLYIYINY